MMTEPTFDHERLDVCRLSIDYVAFSFQIARSLKDKYRFFEIARGSALECAAIEVEADGSGKSTLRRIASMLTRLIQRTQAVSPASIEYEYEYRDAEYEYESNPEA